MNNDRTKTVSDLKSSGVVAVVRTESADVAVEVVRALAAGGVFASEITFTVPGAADAIAKVRDLHKAGDIAEGLVLGAGTVVSAAQANQAIDAGARYLVSPHLALDVVEIANERGVALLPGALTPGEVFAAHAAGADIVKVFPAARMGPSYLKDLRGPYPNIPLMPTGGVSVGNVHEWVGAGAVAVGVGSELVDRMAVAAGDYAEITRRASAFVNALAKARGRLA